MLDVSGKIGCLLAVLQTRERVGARHCVLTADPALLPLLNQNFIRSRPVETGVSSTMYTQREPTSTLHWTLSLFNLLSFYLPKYEMHML